MPLNGQFDDGIHRRRIRAWPEYTISSDGRVWRGLKTVPMDADERGPFVRLGRLTAGSRITPEKTKRYIRTLLQTTWPEVIQDNDKGTELWRGLPEFPRYEMNLKGQIRHIVSCREVRMRANGTVSLYRGQERNARSRSAFKLYRELFGKNYPIGAK